MPGLTDLHALYGLMYESNSPVLDLGLSEAIDVVDDPRVAAALATVGDTFGLETVEDLLVDEEADAALLKLGRKGYRQVMGAVEHLVFAAQGVPDSLAPPLDAGALVAWAERHCAGDALGEPLHVLRPWASFALGHIKQGSRLTVLDLVGALDTGAGKPTPTWMPRGYDNHLLLATRAYLAHAAQGTHVQRERQRRWSAAPPDPGLRVLSDALRAELETHAHQADAAAPMLLDGSECAVDEEELTVALRVPAGTYGYEQFIIARLSLAGWEDRKLRTSCSCASAGPTCDHRRVLVERCLDGVHDAEHGLHQPLARIVHTPTWKRLVTQIARVTSPATARDDGQPRVVWKIARNRHGHGIDIECAIQKRLKNGRWSRGSKCSPEALRYRRDVGMGRADVELIESVCLREQVRWSDATASGRCGAAAIEGLRHVEHVFLANAPYTPVRVQQASLVVRVEAASTGARLGFAIGDMPVSTEQIQGASVGDRVVAILDEPRSTVRIAKLDARVMRLVSAVDMFACAIPRQAQHTIVQALASLQPALELEVAPHLRGRLLTPKRQTVMRVEPDANQGATVRLGVRPVPGGALQTPGSGPVQLFGAVDGDPVHVKRDLEEEARHTQEEAAALGLLSQAQDGEFAFVVDSDEALLELLDVARDREATVVEWPSDATPWRVVGRAKAASLRVQIRRKRDWFGVEGYVEVDGERVALVTVIEAVRSGRKFIRIGPGRFARIEAALRDKLAVASEAVSREGKELVFAHGAAGQLAPLAELGGVEADQAFRAVLARMEKAKGLTPRVPKGLTGELRSYQRDGYRWLARLASWGAGACLADDMGLGKTIQALAMLLRRAGDGPALIVAPTSVGGNWAREAQRFAPGLRVAHYRGRDRGAELLELGAGDVLITSYQIVARDIDRLKSIPFATLVVDEAQAVKNARTKRAKALATIQADWRLALTGTPIENHLGDLWSLFHLISPGLLGTWRDFRERYAIPIERDDDQAQRKALATRVQPFILRRTKARVAKELPPRIETVLAVDLSEPERELYETLRRQAVERMVAKKDDSKERFAVLAEILKLRQLACHPRLAGLDYAGRSAKLDAFLRLANDLRAEGHRALVFSQFTSHLALVREALEERDIAYVYLDGATPAAEREQRVEQFQEGQHPFFLISLKAGGTGLNLTAADYVVHLDPWWNPAVEDQATDRAHRIGQDRTVTIVRMIAQGTIEETVYALHAEKRELATALLEGTERAARLSMHELVDLVRSGERAGAQTSAQVRVGRRFRP